jgi:hypothetical protein
MKITTHIHLAPRLRKGGVIPPLSQYVFRAWYLIKYRNNFILQRSWGRYLRRNEFSSVAEDVSECQGFV